MGKIAVGDSCGIKMSPKKRSVASSEYENSIISHHLLSIIQILCALGTCPLRVNNGGSGKKFSFTWLSYTTLISFIIALWFSWNWVLYMADVVFRRPIAGLGVSKQLRDVEEGIKEDKRQCSSPTTALTVLLLAYATIGLSRFHGILYGWRHVRGLENFLNNWTEFHSEFDRVFPTYLKIDSDNKCMKGRTVKWLLRLLYIFPVVFSTIVNISFYGEGELGLLRLAFATTTTLSMATTELLEDLKACWLFMTLVKAFRMVKSGVEFSVTWQAVTEPTVRSWREIIISIRSQAKSMNKYLAPRQVVIVLETIVLVTSCFYLLVSIDWNAKGNLPILIIWSSLGLLFVARMSLKAYVAEKVPESEADLAAFISFIKVRDSDAAALVQLQFTHDLMVNNPTQARYGSYMVFNNRVILTIFSQVVTYMIVLMQFSQSK